MDMERMIQEAYDNGYLRGYEKGKADRPSGEVDAVKEYEHQVHNLDQGYITLGEFDKRIEPLRHLHYDRPQEWILCSERLPKKYEQVLCCNKDGRVFSSALTYVHPEYIYWYFGKHRSVIAWMPLPEPWKGADDENKD